MTAKKLLRIVLVVVYPSVALACGGATWLTISLSMPEVPNPALYGVGSALAIAAYMYFRTWLDVRKMRRETGRV